MLNPFKYLVIKLINFFKKPKINNNIFLKLLYFEIFFSNSKILISLIYSIKIHRNECGRISFLLGHENSIIKTFGNVGIEVYKGFQRQKIGINCIEYSVNQLNKYFRSCTILCRIDNTKMLLLLDNLNTQSSIKNINGKFYIYEYRRP